MFFSSIFRFFGEWIRISRDQGREIGMQILIALGLFLALGPVKYLTGSWQITLVVGLALFCWVATFPFGIRRLIWVAIWGEIEEFLGATGEESIKGVQSPVLNNYLKVSVLFLMIFLLGAIITPFVPYEDVSPWLLLWTPLATLFLAIFLGVLSWDLLRIILGGLTGLVAVSFFAAVMASFAPSLQAISPFHLAANIGSAQSLERIQAQARSQQHKRDLAIVREWVEKHPLDKLPDIAEKPYATFKALLDKGKKPLLVEAAVIVKAKEAEKAATKAKAEAAAKLRQKRKTVAPVAPAVPVVRNHGTYAEITIPSALQTGFRIEEFPHIALGGADKVEIQFLPANGVIEYHWPGSSWVTQSSGSFRCSLGDLKGYEKSEFRGANTIKILPYNSNTYRYEGTVSVTGKITLGKLDR